MERATGVEPASEAWEASILPMNYARQAAHKWSSPTIITARSPLRPSGAADETADPAREP